MARPRNPENKDKITDLREKLEKAREEQVAASSKPEPQDEYEIAVAREAFRVFWASQKRHYNRPKDIEEILWAHLKATGHTRPELFEKGLAHFGLKK